MSNWGYNTTCNTEKILELLFFVDVSLKLHPLTTEVISPCAENPICL